ncbi:unnamed protein product [Dicrocoelium dendriticum]|nr:unnamed protein product [Dicrocoelium dendriticum]
MMLSVTSLLLLSLCVKHAFCFSEARVPGGFNYPCVPNEEQRLLYAPILQSKLVADGIANPNPFDLLSVSSQIVAGKNYKFVVKFIDNTCMELKFYQPLGEELHKMHLTGGETVPCIQPLLPCRPM